MKNSKMFAHIAVLSSVFTFSDPQNVVDFAAALYSEGPFLRSMYNALSSDGILVSQVGVAPVLKNPPEEFSISKNRVVFMDSLIDLGFQSILSYEDGVSKTLFYFVVLCVRLQPS
jgi:hypothetical protein